MATDIAKSQLRNVATLLAFRGSKTNCIDVKSKALQSSRDASPAAKAKLKELTAEDGSETEVRKCSFATGTAGEAQDVWVMARYSARANGDTFDINVNASAFGVGKRGAEVASLETSLKAK